MDGSTRLLDRDGRVARFFRGRTLQACIDERRDNILQLRLLAALLVVFGHSYVLVGHDASINDPLHLLLPRTYTHLVGVMMFFMTSGLLITLSWLRRPDFARFLRARALRLWPALIVCVLAWAFVIGPVLSDLPLREYFTQADAQGSVYAYAFGNASLFGMQWFLPGVFTKNPVALYVNGSLWTIPVEATLYLCVAIVGALRLFRFPWLASATIATVFGVLIVGPMYTGQYRWTGLAGLGLVLAGFFGAGSIACLLRRQAPISSGLMIVIGVACLLARNGTHAVPFTWLAIGYFVLWFSYVPRLPPIPRGLDVSYGTYLWAFPLQQVVVMAGVRDAVALTLIVTPMVLAVATLSWLCIEKPALRLKDVGWRRRAALQSS